MQTEQTLLELGFTHHPEWDFKDPHVKHYRLEKEGKIFRAYVIDCNGPEYVSIGEVSTVDGKVKCWRDCCSKGSVFRKIKQHQYITPS